MARIKDTRNELGINVEEFKNKNFEITWDGGYSTELLNGRRLWVMPFCQYGYEIDTSEEDKPMYYTLSDYTYQLKEIDDLKVGETTDFFPIDSLNTIKRIK